MLAAPPPDPRLQPPGRRQPKHHQTQPPVTGLLLCSGPTAGAAPSPRATPTTAALSLLHSPSHPDSGQSPQTTSDQPLAVAALAPQSRSPSSSSPHHRRHHHLQPPPDHHPPQPHSRPRQSPQPLFSLAPPDLPSASQPSSLPCRRQSSTPECPHLLQLLLTPAATTIPGRRQPPAPTPAADLTRDPQPQPPSLPLLRSLPRQPPTSSSRAPPPCLHHRSSHLPTELRPTSSFFFLQRQPEHCRRPHRRHPPAADLHHDHHLHGHSTRPRSTPSTPATIPIVVDHLAESPSTRSRTPATRSPAQPSPPTTQVQIDHHHCSPFNSDATPLQNPSAAATPAILLHPTSSSSSLMNSDHHQYSLYTAVQLLLRNPSPVFVGI